MPQTHIFSLSPFLHYICCIELLYSIYAPLFHILEHPNENKIQRVERFPSRKHGQLYIYYIFTTLVEHYYIAEMRWHKFVCLLVIFDVIHRMYIWPGLLKRVHRVYMIKQTVCDDIRQRVSPFQQRGSISMPQHFYTSLTHIPHSASIQLWPSKASLDKKCAHRHNGRTQKKQSNQEVLHCDHSICPTTRSTHNTIYTLSNT